MAKTTEIGLSERPAGQGGQERRPEADRLILPAMKAEWHEVEEGCIKQGDIRGYVVWHLTLSVL